MPVVTMLNLKGGVGKTSATFHLGGTLARSGRRVLLVDNDPQASLTQGFFGPDATRVIAPGTSVAALYDPELAPLPSAVIRPTGFDNLSLIPGSEALTVYNITPSSEWPRCERGMAHLLDEVRGEFDVILIDCPPNLYLCSWAALVASDFIVVPIMAEDYGAQGLGPVQRSVAAVMAGPNPVIRLAGYLVTMFDKRLAIHGAYDRLLRELYGPAVFGAHFPRSKDFVEAVAGRQPISHHRPKCASAKAAQAVADELVSRMELAARERGAA